MNKEFEEIVISLVLQKCKEEISDCLNILEKCDERSTVNAIVALACSCFVKGSVEVMH